MKALLISENKDEWEQLSRICQNIFGNRLQLMCANNPDTALNFAASDGPIGFYIVDLDIRGFNPIALSSSLLDLTGDRPILFIGSEVLFKNMVPEEMYRANEFNERVRRPLEPEEIKEKFTDILEWAKKEEYESSVEELDPSNFLPMRLKNFYLYNSFPYDIYMELATGKYIRIISADRPYPISTLTVYARKSVKFLYIKKDDQIRYLEEETQKCMASLEKLNAKSKDVFLVFLKSLNIAHQYLLALGIVNSAKTLLDKMCDSMMTIVDKNSTFDSLTKNFPTMYEGVVSKSVLTAIISGLVAEKMGYSSATTKKKLFMASFLMDFTLKDDLLSKVNHLNDPRLADYSEEQLAEFVQHPLKVGEIGNQFTNYPDLQNLLMLHHELPDRKGFPNTPGHSVLTQLNSILNMSQYIAAELDGMAIDPANLKRIVRQISKDYNIGTFKDTLSAIRKVLAYEE